MSPIADMEFPPVATVFKPLADYSSINTCILANGNLSIVIRENGKAISIVLEPEKALQIAEVILHACARAKPKSA